MRSPLALVFALLALPAVARGDEKPNLKIELTAPDAVYPDETVTVKAVIRNAGKGDVYVLQATDGAYDGLLNMVEYRWSATKNGQRMARRTDVVRIDGVLGFIGADDVVLVKPGQTMTPHNGSVESYYDLRTPGKYALTLTYTYDPLGTDKVATPALLKQMKALPAAKAEGTVEVTVRPFPPALAAAADKLKAAEARHQLVMTFAETVAKNPASTAAERDAAAERLKRATAILTEAKTEHAEKLTAFRKQRDEDRKKK
ncbi:MAG: hypothetical protein FJ304_07970 [Planctomycetes bacterium]|nr:hypothetical protein [Planctomycetota bacterium]